MKIINNITRCILAMAFFAVGCTNKEEVAVYASFTTDKDVYELKEDVVLVNTSYAENGYVSSSKWEWNGQYMWKLQPDAPISFTEVGEYEIKLTAIATTPSGNITSTCVKTIKVQDTNIRPVADFTYEPQSGIKAGDSVRFTDKSSDADGSIVSWTWRFGTTEVKERNPEFTFVEFGDIPVSLTVMDNMKGESTKEVVIHVDKSAFSLELLWEQAYETDKDAWIKFTSPATNADGSAVYAFSSGFHLAAYSSAGEKLWAFDANKHNPSPYCNDGSKKGNTCTPSVDKDGNIFLALAYNERDAKSTEYESGVYAVTSSGSEKWYFPYGNARYIAVTPVILGDQILLTTKNNPTKEQYPDMWSSLGNLDNGHVLDRNTGAFRQMLKVKQGNYGGAVGFSSGVFITHCNAKYGSRIYFNESGKWKHYGPDDNKSPKALGYLGGSSSLETGDSGQMALSDDGKVYILYENVTGRVSKSYMSVLYCYDTKKFVKDATTPFEPDWTVGINGKMARYNGLGVVCGEDGTLYVTTGLSGDKKARVTAVSSTGSVKWESEADGNIAGSCAVDNEGYVYYNDYSLGKLVKLSPVDGKKISEIQLASDMRSSPTISCDGTIYCVGMKDGYPTLFAVKGSATGHAASWSQLGGNPSKTCVL